MHFYEKKLITDPLKKRRLMLGLTQMEVSSQLGITQSQYSRLERSESDPTKYLMRLSKIFNCDPEELFGSSILREIEQGFLDLPTPNEVGFISHENKPNEVFLDLKKGWYKITDLENLLTSVKGSQSSMTTKQPKPKIRPKQRDTL
tara:strand:- start:107 stop:544 length:438 start_codon:yes stop_codon:yes gene_type:complete